MLVKGQTQFEGLFGIGASCKVLARCQDPRASVCYNVNVSGDKKIKDNQTIYEETLKIFKGNLGNFKRIWTKGQINSSKRHRKY